jgi:hypothetical protein
LAPKVGDPELNVFGRQLSMPKVGDPKLNVFGPQLSMPKVETHELPLQSTYSWKRIFCFEKLFEKH